MCMCVFSFDYVSVPSCVCEREREMYWNDITVININIVQPHTATVPSRSICGTVVCFTYLYVYLDRGYVVKVTNGQMVRDGLDLFGVPCLQLVCCSPGSF